MTPPAQRDAPRIDFPVAIRGASTGFGILLIGPLLAQLTAAFLPTPAVKSLLYFAVVLAFTLAARRIGCASVPALHGAVAALLAYALVLPLQWHFGRPTVPEVALTAATALTVGAVVGWFHDRNRRNPHV